eukprot:1191715-Prorocentrum_minimum.AAC.3
MRPAPLFSHTAPTGRCMGYAIFPLDRMLTAGLCTVRVALHGCKWPNGRTTQLDVQQREMRGATAEKRLLINDAMECVRMARMCWEADAIRRVYSPVRKDKVQPTIILQTAGGSVCLPAVKTRPKNPHA